MSFQAEAVILEVAGCCMLSAPDSRLRFEPEPWCPSCNFEKQAKGFTLFGLQWTNSDEKVSSFYRPQDCLYQSSSKECTLAYLAVEISHWQA